MRRAWIAVSLVLLMLAGWTSGRSQERRCPLTVAARAADIQSVEKGIEVTVEVANGTDDDFELRTRSKYLLFTLRVICEDGSDLSRNDLRDLQMDGRNGGNKPGPPITFGPHETKTYHVTRATFLDDDNRQKRIPPGRYRIIVNLPVLCYDGGESRIELASSKPLGVTLK